MANEGGNDNELIAFEQRLAELFPQTSASGKCGCDMGVSYDNHRVPPYEEKD